MKRDLLASIIHQEAMTIYAEYAHTQTLYVANNVYRETYTSQTKKGFLFFFALQVTDITRYD